MTKRPVLLPCNANLGMEQSRDVDGRRFKPLSARATESDDSELRPDDGWFLRILTWMVESDAHVHLVIPASFAESMPRTIEAGENVDGNSASRDTSLQM